jgi:hypothetical protein
MTWHPPCMTSQKRPHRSAAATVQLSPEGRAVLSVSVGHTHGYPHHQTDFLLEIEQVYERNLDVDQLLAILTRLIEAAQARRGRVVARPTPLSSKVRQRGAAGAPLRGATGGERGERSESRSRGTDTAPIPGL